MASTITDHPARRPEIERLLNEYHVQWEFDPALPLAEIDQKRSFANQARVDQPIQADLVETYVVAKKAGDIFPAIVVHKDGKNYVNVDGNHRYAADTKLGVNTTPAYKVSAKAETIRVLMTLLNVIHGRALSEKEKLWHAFFLIDSGTPHDRAAEILHLPLTRLRSAWALEQANRRARQVGINRKAWGDLPQNTRIRLSQASTDVAFKEAFELSVKGEMKGQEINDMITEVNKHRSEAQQMEYLKTIGDAIRDRIQATAGGKIKREQSPKHALKMHLAAVNNINLTTIPGIVNEDEGSAIAEICLAAADALTKLADQLTADPALRR